MRHPRRLGRTSVCLALVVTAAAALAARQASDRQPGAIVGQVVDALTGRPVPNAWLVVWDGGDELDETLSDDLGRFVLRDIPNQLVTIRARPAFWGGSAAGMGGFGQRGPQDEPTYFTVRPGEVRRNVEVPFWRSGTISGRVLDNRGNPVAGSWVTAFWADAFAENFNEMSQAVTDADGVYQLGHLPGLIVIRASSQEWRAPSDDASARPRRFQSTYAPSTTDIDQANVIKVEPGEEQRGVDITLVSGPAIRLTGMVEADGTPVSNARVTVASRSFTTDASSDTAGRFIVDGLIPGAYTITASETTLVGSYGVILADADVTVRVPLRAPPVIYGRVVFEGFGDRAQLARATSIITRGVDELPSHMSVLQYGRPNATPAPDGLFAIPAILWRQILDVSPPDGWMVRSIVIDGHDAIDAPLDSTGPISAATITMTDRVNSVSGIVRPRPGTPINGSIVWVLPIDQTKWRDHGPYPLTVHEESVDDDGAFSVEDLPPGSYLAVAVPQCVESRLGDVDFLRRLAPMATRIDVALGEQRRLDLNVVSPPPIAPKMRRPATQPFTVPAPAEIIRDREPTSSARVTGLIVSSMTGAPIPNARVAAVRVIGATGVSNDVYEARTGARVDAVTDVDGRFVIAHLPSGRYTLRVARLGFAEAGRSWNELSDASVFSIGEKDVALPAVALQPTAQLSGTVTDDDGRPIPWATVTIGQPGPSTSTVELATAVADDLGRYVFGSVDPGVMSLTTYVNNRARPTTTEDLASPLAVAPAEPLLSRFDVSATPGAHCQLELKAGERRVVNLQIRKY